MNKLDNLTLDHENQKLGEKLYDSMKYVENPLRRENERDLEDLCRLNSEIERLTLKKREVLKQKKQLENENRKHLEEVGELKRMVAKVDKERKRLKKGKGKKKLNGFLAMLNVMKKDEVQEEEEEEEEEDGFSGKSEESDEY